MFLTTTNLVHYLLARGHVQLDDVVEGDFMAAEIGRRNRNFQVFRQRGEGLFLKQPRSFEAADTATLKREATTYRLAGADAGLAPLARLLPRWLDYDTSRHCLIVGLLAGISMAEYQRQRNAYPVELGRRLGRGLGTWHGQCGRRLAEHPDLSMLPRQPPWILSLHHLPPGQPQVSGGISQLVEVVRSRPELTAPLDALRASWRADGLIHGDVKWDNCLVLQSAAGGEDEAPELRFVDWELVDVGDTGWDVGAVLQAYLVCWILSMNVQPGLDPRALAATATVRLERLQPAVGAFWRAYCETRGWPVAASRPRLLRDLSFGAGRMVQTAYEYLQASPQLSGHAVLLLQTAANILKDPSAAAAELLAL